jgi:N-acetylglucosamine-6-sulfatase
MVRYSPKKVTAETRRRQLMINLGGYNKFVKQGLNDNYLPVWLQEAGYATYYVGKLFNYQTIANYFKPFAKGWTGSVY